MGLIHYFLRFIDDGRVGKVPQSSGRKRPLLRNKKWKRVPVKHSPQRPHRRNPALAVKNGLGGRSGFIAYHGTPMAGNAKSILRDGWMVGSGNAYGDGIYLSKDIRVAQNYAGAGGVILKCRISPKRCAKWQGSLPAQYQQWCTQRNIPQNNSAKTAFLLQQGFHTLLVDSNTVVVLLPQYANPSAWKRKIEGLKVLSVHRASDYQRIRL
jgi:hypothetical protein